MYVCNYACMYLHMYVCIHVCMCVHIGGKFRIYLCLNRYIRSLCDSELFDLLDNCPALDYPLITQPGYQDYHTLTNDLTTLSENKPWQNQPETT